MHQEFRRIVPTADTAVLFVHGIVGTPRHFDDLIALLPDTVSVHNLLLAGHGGSVRDFSRASMKAWVSQVEQAVTTLAQTHQRIYMVAHSMGTLLSIEAALNHKEIEKLFLLAVPLRISVKKTALRNMQKVTWGNISADDYPALATQRSCSIQHERNPLPYLGWIPRFLELLSKIRTVRKLLPQLTTPCLAVQAMKDELVSFRSLEELERNPHITVTPLHHAGHFYYPSEDYALLQRAFSQFINLS